MPIGVNNLSLQPLIMHGIRQSVRFIMFTLDASSNISLQKFSNAQELYHDQLVLFAPAIRTKLQVYFEHTPARFAFITAITSQRTGKDYWPLKTIFRVSPAMVQDDQKHGFKLFSESLDGHLAQALNDLLDDPQGDYFIDDNHYTDIALIMINHISAEIRYFLPIGYLGLRNDIAFQVFSELSFQRRSYYYGQYFAENPVKIIHSS